MVADKLLPVLLLLAIAPAPPAAPFPARVVGVSDGDTITVLREGKERIKVRLASIDAPESGQDFGARAKDEAIALAAGLDVTVRARGTDRYGRTVAEVLLPDGRSLNRELVARGLAWWYRQYAPADSELKRLEAEARAARRGLWAAERPTPPWAWRKGEGAAAGVVGNRRTLLHHAANCRAARSLRPANRADFPTTAAAEAAGYRAAKDCPGRR